MGMDSVELVMEFEDAFDIRLSDAEVVDAHTVGEAHTACVRAVKMQHPDLVMDDAHRAAMMHRVRLITSEQLVVDYERTVPEARFVKDLGMY